MKKTKMSSYYRWREVIMNYLENICYYCGTTQKLNIHHVIPLSSGGKNEMANLEVVCVECHKKLHKQIQTIWPTDKKFIPYKAVCSTCSKGIELKGLNKNIVIKCGPCKKKVDNAKTRVKKEA